MQNRLLSLFLLLVVNCLQAHIHQQVPNSILPYLTEDSTVDWMEFESPSPFKALNADFQTLKSALGLEEHECLHIQKQQTDKLGWKHYRLQHQYEGLDVIGSEFIVHEFDGQFKKANGKLIQNLKVDITPTFPEEQALQAIFDTLKAQKYAWEDAHYEKIIKTLQEDDKATFCPKGKLVVVSPNFERNPEDYRLAWEFDIFAIQPLQRFRIFIDAQDGSVVTSFSRIQHGDTPSTGVTNYAGLVGFHGESYGSNNYRLHNSILGDGIETYNANELHSYPYIDFVNQGTHWGQNSTRTAIDAHWGTEQVYNYFMDTHNYESYDGNGGKLMSWVHYAKDYVNAFWNGQWMTYGNGNGTTYSSLTSLDIVAHEITHGIIENTANLVYRYEPGALNESFADIFGVTLEFLKHPNGGNWYMGDQCHLAGNGFRSMENPNLFEHPDTFDGEYWVGQNFCTASPWNDYCGVHVNSSVQNKWYFLLVEGETGVNDHGEAFNVEGIGLEKAAAIAFRNLTVYLTSTSEFADARAGSIQSAIDIYGAGSNEVEQVVNAWCAVGVGGCEVESSEVLTLISPNGGEIWEQGTSQTIRWNSVGDISEVKIRYSINNGASWITVTNATNNDGSYQWLVPNNPTGMGIIEVISIDDENVKDKSDDAFTILGCTTIAGFSVSTTEICENENITASNNSINYSTLEWQVDGLTESTQEIFEKNFTESGTYAIRLIAYGDNNCSDTHEISVNVYAQPNANFHYTSEDFTYEFFAEDLNASQYSWTVDEEVSVSTEPFFNYTFVEAGNYEVCLEVMNEDCENSVEDCQMILIESVEEETNVFIEKTIGEGFNDAANKIIPTSDGNLLIAGRLDRDCQNTDCIASAMLSKLDKSGNKIWIKKYDADDGWEMFYDVIEVNDGFIAVGECAGGCGATIYKSFVVKTDLEGNEVWRKLLGGSNWTRAYTILEVDNGYLISGSTTDTDAWKDMYVMKISLLGTIEWQKYYNHLLDDVATDMIQTSDGGYLIVGQSGYQTTNPLVPIIKIDNLGEVEWSKSLGGEGCGQNCGIDRAFCVLELPEGGFVVGGQRYDLETGENKAFFIKTDANGNEIMGKIYGSANWDGIQEIHPIDGNRYLMGGFTEVSETNREAWVMTTDLEGNVLTEQKFGGTGTEEARSIIYLGNERFAFVGYTSSTEGGDNDIYLVIDQLETNASISKACWSSPDIYNPITEQIYGSSYRDFNEDGYKDIIITHNPEESVTIYMNNGDGSFDNGTSVGVPAIVRGNTFEDFDQDGNLDFALSHPTSFSGAGIGLVSVYFGNGDGTFKPSVSHNIPGSWTYYLASGNIDEDEYPDLIVTAAGSNKFFVLLNDGTGDFSIGNSYDAGFEPLQIGLADFDGDGRTDIVIGSIRNGGQACIFKNQGGGSFGEKQIYMEGLTSTFMWAGPIVREVVDIDNKNGIDVLITLTDKINGNNKVYTYLLINDGSGQFTEHLVREDYAVFKSCDWNNDGKIDILTNKYNHTDLEGNTPIAVKLLENIGNNTFTETEIITYEAINPDAITYFEDLNNDNLLDYIGLLRETTQIQVTLQENCETEQNPCSITANFNNTTSNICLENQVSFTNTSLNAVSNEWILNGQSISTNQNLNFTFQTKGSYTLTLVVRDGLCEDSYSETFRVYENAELDLGTDIAVCETSYTLTSNVSEMLDYEWRFNGDIVGTSTELDITESGTYLLTVTDRCGQEITDEIEALLDYECVFPGDANYDGIVNNYDWLSMSLPYGFTGFPRPNATTVFEPQAAQNWDGTSESGFNFKHNDADGNGLISFKDFEVALANYGKTHTPPPPPPGITISPISLVPVIATYPTIDNGGLLHMDIMLQRDSTTNSGITASGIAFTINYFAQSGFLTVPQMTFVGSDLGREGINMATVTRNYPEEFRFEVGAARLDHKNATNVNKVGTVTYIVDIDNIPTIDSLTILMDLTGVHMIQNNGNSIPVGKSTSAVTIHPEDTGVTTSIEAIEQMELSIFPNPSNGIYYLHSFTTSLLSSDKGELILYNIHGQEVWKQRNITNLQSMIDIRHLPNGIYYLKWKVDNKSVSKKIVKQ